MSEMTPDETSAVVAAVCDRLRVPVDGAHVERALVAMYTDVVDAWQDARKAARDA